MSHFKIIKTHLSIHFYQFIKVPFMTMSMESVEWVITMIVYIITIGGYIRKKIPPQNRNIFPTFHILTDNISINTSFYRNP